MVERANRSVLQMLRTYVERKEEWERLLPLLLYAYRTSVHASTGTTPFEVMFGRQQDSFLLPYKEQTYVGNPEHYRDHLHRTLAELHEFVEANLVKAGKFKSVGTIYGPKYQDISKEMMSGFPILWPENWIIGGRLDGLCGQC